jgi:hypothetical protein
MRLSLRTILLGAFASAWLVLSPYSTPSAHAILVQELTLNASNVQVVQNPGQTDVLNMSLIVTGRGDGGAGPLSCDPENDDLIESGVHVGVYAGSCSNYFSLCFGIAGCPTLPFSYFVNPYVEHDIGSTSYGTFFGLNGPGTVASKIVALATPPGACGRWTINLQATGLDLSSITSSPMALLLNDSDNIFPICDDVAVKIGNGIVKSAQGAHSVRH